MGHVTRIVSGCRTAQATQEQELHFKTYIHDGIPTGNDRFHIYITTEDYARTKSDHTGEYKFFNKPFGLYEWIQNVLQMPSSIPTTYKDTMFIILDPDQIILRPFSSRDFRTDNIRWYSPSNFYSWTRKDVLRDGNPIAQVYAMGPFWIDYINQKKSLILDVAYNATLNDTTVFTNPQRIKSNSYIHTWTKGGVSNHYLSGPPYILTGLDLYRIVKVWAAIVVTVYEVCERDFLSEMFAYITASAYLNLPHYLASNFMVSNYLTDFGYEGWEAVDSLSPNLVCPSDMMRTTSTDLQPAYYDQLPHIVHYCQEYFHGPYYFFKHYLNDNLLSCTYPLLFDPNDYAGESSKAVAGSNVLQAYSQSKFTTYLQEDVHLSFVDRQRQVFMLCHLISNINTALIYWKDHNCMGEKLVNYQKNYIGCRPDMTCDQEMNVDAVLKAIGTNALPEGDVAIDNDSIHIVFSTGCSKFQDCK
jgi:hypothetical protein